MVVGAIPVPVGPYGKCDYSSSTPLAMCEDLATDRLLRLQDVFAGLSPRCLSCVRRSRAVERAHVGQ